MTTNQQDNTKLNTPGSFTIQPDINDPAEIRDFREIRILKQDGWHGVTLPVIHVLPGALPQTAANWTAPFFIANRAYQVLSLTTRWETKAGAAATFQLRKVATGTAPASGIALLTTAIDLTQNANINYSGVMVSTYTSNVLDPVLILGDSLCLTVTGTIAAVVGVTVQVNLKAI